MGATRARLGLFGLSVLFLWNLFVLDAVWAQDGMFYIRRDLMVGGFPLSVAVGNINGDARDDVAATYGLGDGGTVSIRLSLDDGSFEALPDVGVGSRPGSIAVGDFNGDGRLDLATANGMAGSVSIRLGGGDGTFGTAPDVAVGAHPLAIAVGDFNGDGRPDLATGNLSDATVSVRLGLGDGTFGTAPDVAVGAHPLAIAVGDFNGDGRPDLATANLTAGTVSILINKSGVVVNDLIAFDPIPATFNIVPAPTGCPAGFTEVFSFEARLTNVSESSLTDLVAVVTTLSNGTLLQNADGGPGGIGAGLTVPQLDRFTDGVLSPGEFVDVPFLICLTQEVPFQFIVDIFGEVE